MPCRPFKASVIAESSLLFSGVEVLGLMIFLPNDNPLAETRSLRLRQAALDDPQDDSFTLSSV